ncbi:hypothetical protein PAP_08155 [Palaeococcus pacificus DY20341]|uniref:Uncharacterized protein n=1 Tax=Palaeococcus pacificus DY20341 TaxID=1343739 RepID=A0A075LUG8_9EURY|nr:hypothetical protein PAP_08155 [Palaeococcus pacificus DY20341]
MLRKILREKIIEGKVNFADLPLFLICGLANIEEE